MLDWKRKQGKQDGYIPLQSRGFTFIELMVTLVIVGIVALFAVPALRATLMNSELSTKQGAWVGFLATARSEAITRNSPVSMCVSAGLSTCDGDDEGDWETGWIMFVDDGEGTGGVAQNRVRDGAEELIQVQGRMGPGLTLRMFNYAADDEAVMFRANGMAEERGSWRLCDDRGAQLAKVMNVNLSGQITLGFDSNDDGTKEDYLGNEVTTCP